MKQFCIARIYVAKKVIFNIFCMIYYESHIEKIVMCSHSETDLKGSVRNHMFVANNLKNSNTRISVQAILNPPKIMYYNSMTRLQKNDMC